MSDNGITIVLPQFTPTTKRMAQFVGVVWILHAVVALGLRDRGIAGPLLHTALIPDRVYAGQIWRVLSWPLLEDPTSLSALWTILGLWWFASPVEQRLGKARLRSLLLTAVCVCGAFPLLFSRLLPSLRTDAVFGGAPIMSAFLTSWGVLHANERMSFFGLVQLLGWQLTAFFAGLTVVFALLSGSALGIASIGGLLAGYFFTRSVTAPTAKKPTAKKGSSSKDSSGRFRVIQGGRSDDEEDPHRWN